MGGGGGPTFGKNSQIISFFSFESVPYGKKAPAEEEEEASKSKGVWLVPKVVACLGDVPTQWLLKSDRLQPQMPSHYHLMQQLLPGNAIENTSQRRQICHQPLFWRFCKII